MRPIALLALLAACGRDSTDPPVAPPVGDLALRAVVVADGLENPLALTAPTGDARLFVVEQPGRIRVIENGALRATPFLDITARVSSGGERGLLGLAFHPRYTENGYFFVNYTDAAGDTRIERHRVSADRHAADPASATLVLAVDQPFANHNGGQLLFGPDGMLYIPLGDGGGSGDPQGNARDPATLLGKLLRVSVDGAAPYDIPADNPYVGLSSRRNEIWASGLRNPWRIAFDASTGRLYVADVGQGRREELNVVPAAAAGLDYGWNRMEGSECFNASSCDRNGLTLPVLEYGHDEGCSITGGLVYRGTDPAMAPLVGAYFYSDFCGGWLRSVRVSDAGVVSDQRSWDVGSLGNVLSFGQDAAGALYVLSNNGRVYRIEGR